MIYLWFIAAAIAEIAGCFAVWAWVRLDKSALWLMPGLASLAFFAWALTRRERHRRSHLCGLWRDLYRRVHDLVVAGRRKPARPLGPDRISNMSDRQRNDPAAATWITDQGL
ncbi:hypothetical protein LCGC14_0650510 [marine sediment metagenome]|uniref:Uncharacterized protein n=1 Tax=marine sediment metagenome TaxID=412755 RepID=A0A0F9R1R1_9ZZZZ